MALIVVPNKGSPLHSNIKSRHATGRELLNSCTDTGHRYQGNCAEMAAIDEIQKQGWNLKGAYIAVYGVMSGVTDWLSPCVDKDGKTGCGTILQDADLFCITKRGLEVFDLDPRGFLSQGDSARSIIARAGSKPGAQTGPAPGKKGAKPGAPAGPTTGGGSKGPAKAACRSGKVKRFLTDCLDMDGIFRRSFGLSMPFDGAFY